MEQWNYNRELLASKTDEAYHRKKMEFAQERVKLIEETIKKQGQKRLKLRNENTR